MKGSRRDSFVAGHLYAQLLRRETERLRQHMVAALWLQPNDWPGAQLETRENIRAAAAGWLALEEQIDARARCARETTLLCWLFARLVERFPNAPVGCPVASWHIEQIARVLGDLDATLVDIEAEFSALALETTRA